jgi:hypothetical protein
MTEDDHVGYIWIRTTPGPGTTFRVTLEINDDIAADLGHGLALVHARSVMAAVAHAEYDAAVVAQMRDIGMPDHAVSGIVQELRSRRRGLSWPTPLSLVPLVASRTGLPMLHAVIRGNVVGTWDVADAREHVLACLECVEVAELDSAFLESLMKFDVDEPRARAMVCDLERCRPGGALAEPPPRDDGGQRDGDRRS